MAHVTRLLEIPLRLFEQVGVRLRVFVRCYVHLLGTCFGVHVHVCRCMGANRSFARVGQNHQYIKFCHFSARQKQKFVCVFAAF